MTLKTVINDLVEIIKKEYHWIIPFILMFFVFNNISYGLIFALIFFFTFIVKKKSLLTTLFFVLIFCLPIEKDIRSWNYIVVPYRGLMDAPGYQIFFSITPKLIFTIATILIIISRRIKNKISLKNKSTIEEKILLLFMAYTVFSTFFTEKPKIAMIGIISIFIPVFYYIISQHFFRKNFLRKQFLNYITFLSLFLVAVGVGQSIKKTQIGIFFENFKIDAGSTGQAHATSTGFVTTDGATTIFRIIGIAAHPTFFASLLSMLLPINISIFLDRFLKNKKINTFQLIQLINIIGIIYCIIQTYSRSSWVCVIFIIASFIYKYKEHKKMIMIIKHKIFFTAIVAIISIFTINLNTILMRVQTLGGVFTTTGTGYGRIEHIRQALYIFERYPLVGVGLNNFTSILDRRVDIQFREFLYPIHNTILLFATEIGIPAAIIFLIFLYRSIKIQFILSKKSMINFGLFLSSKTFIFN